MWAQLLLAGSHFLTLGDAMLGGEHLGAFASQHPRLFPGFKLAEQANKRDAQDKSNENVDEKANPLHPSKLLVLSNMLGGKGTLT